MFNVATPPVYSNWWKNSASWKISVYFAYIFRTTSKNLTKFWSFNLSLKKKHFGSSKLNIWNIWACAYGSCSVLHTCYKFPDRIWRWNLHWGYSFIKELGQWFYQIDHKTFSKNVLDYKLYTVLLLNLFCPNSNFIAYVEADVPSKLHTRKYFQEKLCHQIHDVFYRPYLSSGILNVSFQLMINSKFVKSMYERIVASCESADESYFKRRDVEIFWSEQQSLVKKSQAFLKI